MAAALALLVLDVFGAGHRWLSIRGTPALWWYGGDVLRRGVAERIMICRLNLSMAAVAWLWRRSIFGLNAVFARPWLRGSLAVTIVVCTALLGGCAVLLEGEKFVPVEDIAGKATLYLFRDNIVVGRGLDLDVVVNGETLVTLPPGSFDVVHMEPGELRFGAVVRRGTGPLLSGIKPEQLAGNLLLTLAVAANQTYYVTAEEGLGSLLLEPLSHEEAWTRLPKLRKAGTF